VSHTGLPHRWSPSPNVEERKGEARPELLIIHYTGMRSADDARRWLCDPRSGVSCHYLVDEIGSIIQMVDENARAWHAGVSSWRGLSDINSHSIGIEVHNPGHDLGYCEFAAAQIEAVAALAGDIVARHTIRAGDVLAHSDVAPARKRDPGEKFPWSSLHRAGVGLWVEPAPVGGSGLASGDQGKEVERLQRRLADFGYGIPITGNFDLATGLVVQAFQRHYRPRKVDGIADRSTIDTLERLMELRKG
jgi:N-acetylmuramoyl-L-alanine amidase